MQQKVVQFLNKSDDCEVGIERNWNRCIYSLRNPFCQASEYQAYLTPSTKLHILLDHLEEFLLIVNTDRPDSQPLGLGYFAESVLESSNRTFKELLTRFHGANKLLRAVVEFNTQSIGHLRENINKDSLSVD